MGSENDESLKGLRMKPLLYTLLLASGLETSSLEEKVTPVELPDDFPKEAVVCQDILATEDAVCTKRLPIRDALALVDTMILEWSIGLSGQSYLTKPYIVTNFDPLFQKLSKQRPPF